MGNITNNRLRILVLVLSIILVLCLAAGGTLAYLSTQTDPVDNQFENAYVTCRINRDGDSFDVTNTGNISAFIRATLVVNWMDEDGNVLGSPPTAADVTLTVNETDWAVLNDGFLYYTRPVAPGQDTGDLITVITLNVIPPAGYHLSVEVVAEAIQAQGVDGSSGLQAALDAWGSSLLG